MFRLWDDYEDYVIMVTKKKTVKPNRLALNRRRKRYPWSLSVHITYGQAGKKTKEAHLARDEIEREWMKFGNWIGHGSSLGASGDCDVQVSFKTYKDVEKAKKLAVTSMFKHGVSGRYHQFKFGNEE
jgi:hypothetical protein